MWAVCGFLLAAVILAFGQTVRYEFVNYDDDQYVYENPHVKAGLTPAEIAWAFTRSHAGNWHPITWLSHMLDYQLYGLWAGGHHLTNVLLHAASAVLLFLVFLRMTGDLWPSALAAAYAETGQLAKAIQIARRSLALATAQNNRALAEAVRAKIDLYRAGAACRAR